MAEKTSDVAMTIDDLAKCLQLSTVTLCRWRANCPPTRPDRKRVRLHPDDLPTGARSGEDGRPQRLARRSDLRIENNPSNLPSVFEMSFEEVGAEIDFGDGLEVN